MPGFAILGLLLAALVATPARAAHTLTGPFDDTVASYTTVTNGTMETHSGTVLGTWVDYYSGKLGYDSRGPYAGSGAAGLLDQSWSHTGAGVALQQTVSVTRGASYVLSGYVYNAIVGGGNAYLDLADQSYAQADGGSGDCGSLSTSGAATWQFVYCQFTASSSSSSVTVRTVVDGTVNPGSYAFFDQVALTPAASFSPPESLSTDDDGDGYSELASDCDDGDASLHPGAAEYCDGVDEDCDGIADEGAVDAATWYQDGDGDGYGGTIALAACTQPSGYLATSTDCDDADTSVHPGASEHCDGVDEDCDGTVDDGAVDMATWYLDGDGDGYGGAATSIACTQPSGHLATSTDCADADATIHPGAAEWCNGVDDDCSGVIDDSYALDALPWHPDLDGDGYGDATTTWTACTAPSGCIADDSDCDDHDAAVNPAAAEWCDGYDDDCDGMVDEADAVDATTWYHDGDGDGFGDPLDSTVACDPPPWHVAAAGDCDDTNFSVYPGSIETWYDGVDQDCDGNDDDQDLDGWPQAEDCDDEDPLVHPEVAEVWYDGVDQDCDGASDFDQDGDGHDSATWGGDDCDDSDPATFPGAPDAPYDGVINDCDAADEYDADGDGHDAERYGGDDCDDHASDVHPGATEVWYDGIDQDCDGNDDDQDGDGWPLADDCDDTDPDAWPGAEGWSEDCEPLDPDSGGPADTDAHGDSAIPPDRFLGGGGCRCSSSAAPGLGWPLFGLLGLVRSRRRRPTA